jgi:hypothetical protein
LFVYAVSKKKGEISRFMEANFGRSWKSGKGESQTEHYYKLFLETYMEKDAKGNWTRKLDKWTQDAKGNWTPNKPAKKQP